MSTGTKYMAAPAVELVHLSNELGFSNELNRVSTAHQASALAPPSLCRADLPEAHGYLSGAFAHEAEPKSSEVCFLDSGHVPASRQRRAPQLVELATGKPTCVPKMGTALFPAIIHAPSTPRAISCARGLHHLAHSPAIGDVAASLRAARFSGLQEGSADRVFRRGLK